MHLFSVAKSFVLDCCIVFRAHTGRVLCQRFHTLQLNLIKILNDSIVRLISLRVSVFFPVHFCGVMDFILSKIINRPRAIATSDDEEIAKALVDIETHQVPYGEALFEVKTCAGFISDLFSVHPHRDALYAAYDNRCGFYS